jgi:hypothetical protein
VDLAKLVLAIEASADGSEYLDYSIQRLFGLKKPVPLYTRSVDAALALVPEGFSLHRLQQRTDCRGNFASWLAELYRATDVVIDIPSTSSAATAPLALCGAALRVIRALQDAADQRGLPEIVAAHATR